MRKARGAQAEEKKDRRAPEQGEEFQILIRPSFCGGRIGLRDEVDEPVLLVWRAPASRAFYVATGAHPEDMRRRRQFRYRSYSAAINKGLHGKNPSSRTGT